MKKFYWILLALVVLSCKTQPDAVRKLTHNNLINPPGTVWLKDSLYIDQAEISNLNYLEYVGWIRKKDPQNYESVLPDTLVWRTGNYGEPAVEYYFRHPSYYDYPVVGVSYEQAIAFCKWRTERVKEFYNLRSRQHKFFQNFEYRLPTKEEWEYAASAGLDSNRRYGFESLISKNNLPKVWTKESMSLYCDKLLHVFAPVGYGAPNKYGLYNMIGNVAEMINEKGISKGGSFLDILEDCGVQKAKMYNEPSVWLGFRCVCQIH